ncbi:MAG: hypothetical protein ACFFCV_21545 [Promethearchaeota archaeon]
MGSSGKGLGIFALLLAMGALGLGIYQFILPAQSPTEKPRIYVATNYNVVDLNLDVIEVIPNLNVTYNVNAGDSVLLEFSCEIHIDCSGGSLTIDFYFEINGSPPSPYTEMTVIGDGSTLFFHSSCIMKADIQSNTADTHVVKVVTWAHATSSSYIKECILSAMVY